MEEPKNSPHREEEEKNPIIVFFSNLFAAIQKLPFLQPKNGAESESAVAVSQAEEPVKVTPVVAKDESNTSSVVTFPKQDIAPLKLEAEADEGQKSTNPTVLWQVYAIGGLLVVRWAWIRWNERKGRKKSGDEPPPASD